MKTTLQQIELYEKLEDQLLAGQEARHGDKVFKPHNILELRGILDKLRLQYAREQRAASGTRFSVANLNWRG